MLQNLHYDVYKVLSPCFGKKPMELLTEKTLSELAPRGNYIALPSWAKHLVEKINSPVDTRIFTNPSQLMALKNFLEQTEENIIKEMNCQKSSFIKNILDKKLRGISNEY
jgi:hypothetical protein